MDFEAKERHFGVTLGLPNVGLDPARDCHHVSDSELVSIFGAKVRSMGYKYTAAKCERVRSRVVELLPVIYQTPLTPEVTFIPESFARALVSEVCHHTQMNWARYAAGLRKGDVVQRNVSGDIVFMAGGQKKYSEVAAHHLRELVEAATEEWKIAEETLERKCKEVEILTAKQQNPDDVGERLKQRLELENLHVQLKSANDLLENWRKSQGSIEECGNEGICKWYKAEISAALQKITGLEQEIRVKLESRMEAESALQNAIEEEQSARATRERLTSSVEKTQRVLGQLEAKSRIPLTRTPSPYIGETILTNDVQVIHVQACAFCKSPFPLLDIVVAPCTCLYHPWCISMQTWIDEKCASRMCNEPFPPSWLKSFGYYKTEGPFETEVYNDPQKRRSHLNSDIGGLNYNAIASSSRKKKKESSAESVE